MLQVYSYNIDIDANSAIPFNNIVINKGAAEKLTAPASIELEQRGIYMVKVDGFGTGSAAGTGVIQLYVNGVAQPQAQSQFTTAAGNVINFGFNTLVQVPQSNCSCNCYTSPTVLQIRANDQALTEANINVIVTKLC